MKLKRIGCAAAAAVLIIANIFIFQPASPIAAASSSSELTELEDKLAKAAAQRAEAQKAVDAAKSERSDAIAAKKAIDNKILALNAELDALLGLIDSYEIQIAEKDSEIAEETDRLDKQFQIVRERIRANREDGGADMLTILLETDGLADFFMRLDRFICMMEYNENLMNTYLEGVAELNLKKDELVGDRDRLEVQKSELESKRKELDDDLAEAQKLIDDAEADVQAASAMLEQVEEEEKKYNSEREKKLTELQKSSNQSYVGGTFLWPLSDKYTTVSCGYGWRIHPITKKQQFHLGIDIPAAYGTPIYAVNDGTVIEVSYNYADGYYVTISHGGGVASFYSHVSKYAVKVGDKVKRGQTIAYVGTSGYATGPHLNLNIYENNKAVDPLGYFTKAD
ncbi:MAG: peptidoglycan DD-metalloendopeptidase family protein [Clostridiales bacterium]|nr:peptidoglycan DD-metalloendopeptidase family protein [Clostridiales bacterium]